MGTRRYQVADRGAQLTSWLNSTSLTLLNFVTHHFDQVSVKMTDSEYIKTTEEAWQEAIDIAKSEDGWKEEKSDKKTGDIVESRKNPQGRKIYRCKARIEMPAKLLIEAMSDTDKITEWNKTLTQAKVLKVLNEECVISYQVTTDGGGGVVSARDFVFASKKGYLGETFVMGGKSVEYKEAPSSGKIVRAVNGPGCQMVTPGSEENVCHVVWLMDCDYKGWMPQSVLDIAMPVAQTQFIECLRKLAEKTKKEGKF